MIKRPRSWAVLATALFFAVSGFIVCSHWLRLGHVELALSISRHVGLEAYSCILFAIANTVAVVLSVCYLNHIYEVHRFPKVWLVVASAMTVGLLAASCFPFTASGDWSSQIHQAGSWLMFSMATLLAMISMWSLRTRWLMIVGGLFLLYGAACIIWTFWYPEFFWSYVLVIESTFIFLMFLSILSIPAKKRDVL